MPTANRAVGIVEGGDPEITALSLRGERNEDKWYKGAIE